MRRQLLIAVGMSLLLVATLMPGLASAAGPERFGRVDLKKYPIDKDLAAELRNLRDPDRKVMVFIELNRPSVADQVGPRLEAGEVVTDASRRQLRGAVQREQAGVKRDVERLNARVHASFSDVLNGFRATVPAGQIDKISRLAGVKSVYRVSPMERTNANSARYMKVPQAWQQTGLTGNGVKVAIIDTGINYQHHTFGGNAGSTFPTAKVVGGYDFVGDAYGTGGNYTPVPDPDPMDCNGHGTHVAGTAAGFGVLSNGNTYTGPYNASTVDAQNWNVPPGMAPRASLLAYKVFGCDGSTYVVMDAIEMAVRDGAHVINMSLGLLYGNNGRIEEVATNNAVRAGVVVVASSGNSGPSAYITGSPGTADGAISVAAIDANPGFPSVWIDMPTGADIRAINANDSDDLPVTGQLNHFEDNPATPDDEALGCELTDWAYNNFQPGQIAVTYRGVCARVQRAEHGQTLGADAVIMINNSSSLPPFEGPIPGVTIPFLGVPNTTAARFVADDLGTATVTAAPPLTNPNYGWKASFTSGGFRRLDQGMKPDVAAPGVSVFSADVDNIQGGVAFSGTSMAAPAVAGVAALVRQARPNLIPRWIKSLIVNTATTNNLQPRDPRQVGAGVVDALRATRSLAHLTVPNPLDKNEHMFQPSMTFGLRELVPTSSGPVLDAKRSFRVWNRSSRAITYRITNQFATPRRGLSVTITPSRVTVPAGTNRLVTVRVQMSRANAAALSPAAPGHGPVIGFDDFGQLHTPLEHISGRLVLTPTVTRTGVMALRMPGNVVPRGTSNVWPHSRSAYTTSSGAANATIDVRNNGLHQGIADFFQWGLQDQQEGYRGMDMRAAGVQSLPSNFCWSGADPEDVCLNIAINNWTRFSNASENVWIVPIDTDGDGFEDYEVLGIGAELLLGALDGVFLSAVYNVNLGTWTDGIYLAVAPTNSSTIMLPFLASDIGLEPGGNQDFEYHAFSMAFWDADPGDPGVPAQTFDIMFTGNHPGSRFAHYDAWNPAFSNGQFVPLNPGGRANVPVQVDLAEYDPSMGHKGWMVVTLDDLAGERQADLFQAGQVPSAP
jgi:minor extracellular serine protease Vpr